ncbi:hypothetical protein [Phenylobacterium sp. J367]|uniref:hypothetical protein n=1 Tax=Phenylobacterium sp. J367 TaxID=2898435 RepID=UPI0021517631|nr:hypothetical protein [Phenylobacterium sp. J367]MCR5880418.1 hypothetical protein [Phenylobacterium sp. J367]
MQHGAPAIPPAAAAGGAELSGREARIERWREVATAVCLAAAGLLTSWASYQGALWAGHQLIEYGEADAVRVEAANMAQRAASLQGVEVGLINAWVIAKERGDQDMADFYARRMPDHLRPAFREWMAQNPTENASAAESPFQFASYRSPGMEAAAELKTRADRIFKEGTEAKYTSDAYHRAGVILAMAMFFAGISQVFHRRNPRIGLTVVAVLILLVGAQQTLTLPMISLAELMSGGGH